MYTHRINEKGTMGLDFPFLRAIRGQKVTFNTHLSNFTVGYTGSRVLLYNSHVVHCERVQGDLCSRTHAEAPNFNSIFRCCAFLESISI